MSIEIRDDQINELAKEVPWNKIADVIKTKLGMPIYEYPENEPFFKVEVNESRNRKYISIESFQDFKDECGVMSKCYETVKITNFNTSIHTDDDGSNKRLWMTIHFTFTYVGGGSNGAEICTIWYNFNNKVLSHK